MEILMCLSSNDRYYFDSDQVEKITENPDFNQFVIEYRSVDGSTLLDQYYCQY